MIIFYVTIGACVLSIFGLIYESIQKNNMLDTDGEEVFSIMNEVDLRGKPGFDMLIHELKRDKKYGIPKFSFVVNGTTLVAKQQNQVFEFVCDYSMGHLHYNNTKIQSFAEIIAILKPGFDAQKQP